jgi:hypothetical protein
MILLQACSPSAIPLFGQNADHSSVPARVRTAIARSCCQRRPSGRRASASPLSAARALAVLRSFRTILCLVTLLAASMLSSIAANASPATHRASARSANPLAAFVTEASTRFSVPEHWIRAVMRVESGEKSRARSRKGATGLMQIMPRTWAELRARYRLGADPYDIRDNILAGTAYIRELYDRYGAPGFLATYNAGPGRYERHLVTGRPLPAETQAYVATLTPMVKGEQASAQKSAVAGTVASADASLFAAHNASIVPDVRSSAGISQNRSSRTHTAVDLSALVPQSGNLFVRLARAIRSQ